MTYCGDQGVKSDEARTRRWGGRGGAAVAPLCCVRRGSPQTWQETNLFERKRVEIYIKRRLSIETSSETDRQTRTSEAIELSNPTVFVFL